MNFPSPCYSLCSPWAYRTSIITWKLVKNAQSQAPPHIWIWIWLKSCIFNKGLWNSCGIPCSFLEFYPYFVMCSNKYISYNDVMRDNYSPLLPVVFPSEVIFHSFHYDLRHFPPTFLPALKMNFWLFLGTLNFADTRGTEDPGRVDVAFSLS